MTNQTPSNSVVTDLLPCPFCGGKAQELINFSTRTSRQVCGCGNCGVARPTPEAWNTRALAMQSANTTGSDELVAELESDLQMLHRACKEGDPHRELTIRVEDALALLRSIVAPLNAIATPDTDRVAVLTEAREVIFDSLYHLRRDERAEVYHKRAEAMLAKLDAALSQPLGSQENGHGR